LLNPLAIGVTIGGLLLDVITPRPKPRAGLPSELSSSLNEPSRGHRSAIPRLTRTTARRSRAASAAERGTDPTDSSASHSRGRALPLIRGTASNAVNPRVAKLPFGDEQREILSLTATLQPTNHH